MTNTPQIEKNIAIPRHVSFGNKASKSTILPLLQMNVGDSMFVPESIYPRTNLQQNISRFCGLTGYSFTFRKKLEAGIIGVRIWRQKDNLDRHMPQLKVEKGIPISSSGKFGPDLDNLDTLIKKMEVGNSFFDNKIPYMVIRARLNSRHHNLRFISRKQTGGGYRFWRVA